MEDTFCNTVSEVFGVNIPSVDRSSDSVGGLTWLATRGAPVAVSLKLWTVDDLYTSSALLVETSWLAAFTLPANAERTRVQSLAKGEKLPGWIIVLFDAHLDGCFSLTWFSLLEPCCNFGWAARRVATKCLSTGSWQQWTSSSRKKLLPLQRTDVPTKFWLLMYPTAQFSNPLTQSPFHWMMQYLIK